MAKATSFQALINNKPTDLIAGKVITDGTDR